MFSHTYIRMEIDLSSTDFECPFGTRPVEISMCTSLKGLQPILRIFLNLVFLAKSFSWEFGTSRFPLIAKRTWSEETRASRGLAVSKGTWMIRDGGSNGGKERKRRRGDTRNFVIAFQTTLCTLMDSSNQLITVMTRVHQFALIF